MSNYLLLFCIISFLTTDHLIAAAEDWSTYRHDNRRSGVTKESPVFPLKLKWKKLSNIAPMMAWSGPAKWDAYSGNKDLQSMRNFDPVFYVTISKGSVFYGSSVDDSVHCLDLNSGSEKWVAFTSGAVRLPPSLDKGNCFFGSDDGFAYCVNILNGKTIWKFNPSGSRRYIASNAKIISPWPIRTGVLVNGESVFFGASLVPWENTFLCSLDKKTGDLKYKSIHNNMTLQGAFLASSSTLYAPQGRSVPLVFNLSDGKAIKSLSNTGGTFCLLTKDDKLVAMPHNQKSSGNMIQIADPSGNSAMVQFAGADRLLINEEMVYLHQSQKLKALNRKNYSTANNKISINNKLIKQNSIELEKKIKLSKNFESNGQKVELQKTQKEISQLKFKNNQIKLSNFNEQKKLKDSFLWESSSQAPYDLILAGNYLFLGGSNYISAYDSRTGKMVWRSNVIGKVYGLAFAHGTLIASTSKGHLYAFTN